MATSEDAPCAVRPLARDPSHRPPVPSWALTSTHGFRGLAALRRPAGTWCVTRRRNSRDVHRLTRHAGSTQPLPPPPRTSSREPSMTADDASARRAGSSGGQQPVASAAAPTEAQPLTGSSREADQPPFASGLSGQTSHDISDKTAGGERRSLTGRPRTTSRGSKRSATLRTSANEKRPDCASADPSQPSARPAQKKKRGFLSLLNCCAAPDPDPDSSSPQSAQPTKTPAQRLQPTRAKQPSQQSAQPQTTSVTDTSADDSKELIDEKGQPPYQTAANGVAPILPVPAENEKDSRNGTADAPANPPANPPQGADQQDLQTTSEQARQAPRHEALTAGGAPQLDTSHGGLRQDQFAAAAATAPQVNVQAPTPIAPPNGDEQVIADRTPAQEQRDTDIEMTDAGPSLPLSAADVPSSSSDQHAHGKERSESDVSANRVDLPPPPPLVERQAQVGTTGASQQQPIQAQDSIMTSAPDQSRKWLLPPLAPNMRGKKCLVLDLDETLVHSSFKVHDPGPPNFRPPH